MMDQLSRDRRSRNMAKVRSRDTKPERQVRSILFGYGLRFRLNRRDLPGSPDIVLPKHGTVVFVHGCFWHGHDCPRGRRPQSNIDFWNSKLDRNIARDRTAVERLADLGWRVETIWTCRLADGAHDLARRLQARAADARSRRVRCAE